MTGLAWGHGYSHFAAVDSFEAYSFTVDYGLGEPRAQYIGQPNYNGHSKLPGPLWALFCFAGQRFWGSIDGAIFFTIIVNTAAIYLIYLLAQRTLGSSCALLTALLAATLPFPIYYSAFLYNPNVMPFLGALLFLALWHVVRTDRSPRIFWVALILLIMPQFHFSVFAVLPAVAVIFAISPARLNVRWLFGGVLAGAFFYIPYLRGEMANGWQNTLAMRTGKAGHWWGGLKAVIAPWNLLVDYVPQWTRSFNDYRQMGNACFGWFGVLLALNILSGIVAILLLVGVILEIKKAMRGCWRSPRDAFKHAPGIVFLSVLVVVPLLCLLIGRQSFHVRYSIVLLAPLLSLAGFSAVKLSAQPRWGRYFIGAIIVVIVGNLWLMPAFYWHQGTRIEQSSDMFYASFRNLESVYQRLKAHAGSNQSVQVDDSDYRLATPKNIGDRGNVMLIRRYVAVREKESVAVSQTQTRPVIYTVCEADQVGARDAAVAYRAHGIALVQKQAAQ
ncbi:MAG TPA: glycosyltransferase family 39 protein [Verrucomicrobiae bacterium]